MKVLMKTKINKPVTIVTQNTNVKIKNSTGKIICVHTGNELVSPSLSLILWGSLEWSEQCSGATKVQSLCTVVAVTAILSQLHKNSKTKLFTTPKS